MFTSKEKSTTVAGAERDDGRGVVATPVGVIEDRRRPADGPVIDPIYIAKAVWKSKLFIAATTVFGLMAAMVYAGATPKMYVATAQILVDPRDIKVVANEVTPNGLPSEATLALIESQTSVIMSSNVLGRVVERAKLGDDPEFNGEQKTGLAKIMPASLAALFAAPEETPGDRENGILAKLRQNLTVGRETKSFVINLSMDSQDPQKAANVANLVAESFIEEQGLVQSDTARRATDALSSRLSELRRSVVAAESAVEDYKSENALIGVGGRLVDDEYITRINDQLAKARGAITELRVKADSMRTASVEDVVRGTLPEELSSEALVRLRQTYSELAQQAAVLGTKLGPRHPQRIASEGALTASRQAIAAELSRIVAAAQTELARAEQTERDLTAQINELKDKQVTTSGSFVRLRELEREVDASRAVYEAFLLRARETSEQESLNTNNVRIISSATPPLRPSSTSRKVVVAAGGIAGLFVGIGIVAMFAIMRLLRAVFADRRKSLKARWINADAVAMAPRDRRAPAADAISPTLARPLEESSQVIPAGAAGTPPAVHDPADAVSRPEMLGRRPPIDGNAPYAQHAALPAEPEAPSPASGDRALRAHQPHATPSRASRAESDLADAGRATADWKAAFSARYIDANLGTDGDRGAEGNRPGALRPAADMAPVGDSRATADGAARERVSLRDRVRALSEASLSADKDGRGQSENGLDPEVALLRDEIQTVKQAIADIRRRRETSSARP